MMGERENQCNDRLYTSWIASPISVVGSMSRLAFGSSQVRFPASS